MLESRTLDGAGQDGGNPFATVSKARLHSDSFAALLNRFLQPVSLSAVCIRVC